MKKIISENFGTEFSLDNFQEQTYDSESDLTLHNLTLSNYQNISPVSTDAQKSTNTIDGVIPFLEAYCKGIRERKGAFTISCQDIYDTNGILNFDYSLED